MADLGGVTIRPARAAEHELVGELCVAAYRAAGVGVGSYEATLRDVAGRAAGAEVLVAQDGGERVVGTVTFVLGGPLREIGTPRRPSSGCWPSTRRPAGAASGRRSAEACAERARAAGMTGLVCSSQPGMAAAHAVYRKLGFVRDPARDWSPVPGVELVAFALAL